MCIDWLASKNLKGRRAAQRCSQVPLSHARLRPFERDNHGLRSGSICPPAFHPLQFLLCTQTDPFGSGRHAESRPGRVEAKSNQFVSMCSNIISN